jgi:hypothetical protein
MKQVTITTAYKQGLGSLLDEKNIEWSHDETTEKITFDVTGITALEIFMLGFDFGEIYFTI